MDMKKILNIVSDKQQINESMEECGMPMGASMPSTPPVTMNVSLNAQGVDNIKQLLDLMNKADASRMSPAMAMPAGGMDMPISIKKIEPAGSDGERSMGQIKALLSKMDELGSLANAPEEAYADVAAVTTDAGGGVNGPSHPADIRVKDPSPYEEETAEEYANEPDEEYADHNMMIKDLSGGLNREKQQFKKEYPGDNPMAVRETKIRSHLDRLYKEIKEGK